MINLDELDNSGTDDQQITDFDLNTTTNVLTITLEDGGSEMVDLSILDNAGSDDQQLSISGNTLTLEDGGTVNLTPYLDNSDDQDLSDGGKTGVNQTIDIESGSSVTFSVADNDNDSTNELQTITKTGDEVALSNGGGTFDDDHLGTTDQTLSSSRDVILNGNSLTFDGSARDVTILPSGSVGVGIATPSRPLHVNEAFRLSRGGNTTSLIMDRFSGNPNTTMKSFLMGVNASSIGNGEFFIADYNENVAGGGFTRMFTLTDHTLPIKFDQYDGATFNTGNEVALLGVEANGDIVEVNTAKSSKIFYPPAIVIDVSTITTGESIDLWQEYVDRYGTPLLASPSSAGAIPTYDRDELEYYVTDLDSTVFDNVGLDDNGVFTYDVAAVPAGNCTFINVVFVVK